MNRRNKRTVGAQYEAYAVRFLESQGLRMLEQNYFFHGGELDLIAMDAGTVCFIEVKYRATAALGFPEEAVDAKKQRRIRSGAGDYLCRHPEYAGAACRFDVISILGQEITWIKDAF